MFLHMSIHMPQASTSSSLTSCVCASSDSLSGAAIWPPVQYDHLCNMATRAVRSLAQWGQLCDIASCAVWPPVQCGRRRVCPVMMCRQVRQYAPNVAIGHRPQTTGDGSQPTGRGSRTHRPRAMGFLLHASAVRAAICPGVPRKFYK